MNDKKITEKIETIKIENRLIEFFTNIEKNKMFEVDIK